ncbi:MAG: hypothetical protein ACXWI1_02200 [Croceibacterium sp.]
MPLMDIELSLMAFPQRWHGATSTLDVRILLLPVGDPTMALGSGPPFAGTAVHLVANIVAGLDQLPTPGVAPAWTRAFVATPPAVAPTLFKALRDQLVARNITVVGGKAAKVPNQRIKILKSLPASYTQAFPYEGSRPDYFGGDYCCALRDQAPPPNTKPADPDKSIAWGQILSYALRQPALAEHLGLFHRVTLDVPKNLLADGGYLYFTLDASSPANPWVSAFPGVADAIRSYAARLPALTEQEKQRAVFAATLFPVIVAPGNLATAQLEAEAYDDGFAQIVHANQPNTIDAVTLATGQIAPGTEAGIQLGWDDEQVTVWLNNQVNLLHDRVKGETTTPEAPLGVQGYRLDTRRKGEVAWRSLCIVNGTLPFSETAHGGGAAISINGSELWLSPAPVRPGTDDNSKNAQAAWLPLYFAQWAGASVVLADPVVSTLSAALDPTRPLPLPPPANPLPDLTAVPTLRYGNDYEFRVRLVDLTGGGGRPDDPFVHPGPAPTSLIGFRRVVPPKALEIAASPPLPPPRQTLPPAPPPPPVRTITSLSVRRPRIGYPEAIFAGVDPKTFAPANLAALIQDARAQNRAVSVPDPDIDSFIVRVEARVPAHDTGIAGAAPGNLDGDFRVIYSVVVKFAGQPAADAAVTLRLVYTDGIDDIAKMTPPPAGTTALVIPTARDIRLRLYPQCAARPNYYFADPPPLGLSSDYVVRKDATSEDRLFPDNPEMQLQAFWFQPAANVAQLLAQQLGLNQDGLTFSGAAGARTVISASGGLRHSGDLSVVTLANQDELLGHWIVALTFELERDWTWDGFAEQALRFQRDGADIGTIAFPRAVTATAVGNPGQTPDRSRTRIVFLDAIDPHPAAGKFPDELHPHYTVTAKFDAATPQTFTFDIRLPITTAPAQMPKVVATGIAESEYQSFDNYSRTAPRQRYLWIEFDQAIADPDDTYFGRVLAYGPDPLLAADLLPLLPEPLLLPDRVEPPLPIDPEPVRRIFSGQSADFSGLDAMTPLAPATPAGVGAFGTFYLLALPPGISAEALELFGFWTYEFRVGHVHKWSTAQARYGRPLRVSGIQHPAPHLLCAVERAAKRITVSAPYATAVVNGKRAYDFRAGDPQTRIWFMLYAQVRQANGAAWRNVLIDHQLGFSLRDPVKPGSETDPQHADSREPRAAIAFQQTHIDQLLDRLGLPLTTPLSVLAVELLPGPLHVVGGGRWNPPKTTGPSNPTATFQQVESGDIRAPAGEDPLGLQLGTRRILRTSPLTAIPSTC